MSSSAAAFLHRHPRLRLSGVLGAPLLWLGVVYLGSLFALFITSLWVQDSFSTTIYRTWTLENFRLLFSDSAYSTVIVRTILMAAGVTLLDLVIAMPIAYYMAKVARPRVAKLLVVAVLMPLWASYLVKAYAWRIMIADNGVLDSTVGATPGYGIAATVLTLAYLWLPFMILPIYAGFERLPDSLLEASEDLGARAGRTWVSIAFPIVLPSVIAGSIFTFSLSLGDYIAVSIVGGTTQMLGTVVLANQSINVPLSAAMATFSVAIMLVYLTLVRRTGALENL